MPTTIHLNFASLPTLWSPLQSAVLNESDSGFNKNLTSVLPTHPNCIASTTVSGFFVVCFAIFLLVQLGFFVRTETKKVMKRNQKVLLILSSILVGVQLMALILRIIYFAIAFSIRAKYTSLIGVKFVIDSMTTSLVVFGALEFAFSLFQAVTMVVIISFIQYVFLTTVHLSGAMTKKVYKVVRVMTIVMGILTAVAMGIFIIVLTISKVLTTLGIYGDVNQTAITVVVFILFIIIIFTSLGMLSFFGFKVVTTIKSRSLNLRQETNRNLIIRTVQKPLIKTVSLLISLVLSTFILILSAIIGIITSSVSNDFKAIDYSLNSFGILFFSVVILFLYNPLFSESYKVVDSVEEKEKQSLLGDEMAERVQSASSLSSAADSPRTVDI
ncbi:predicted protein [Naegleria gruberi]|uniref:Predicted protein n=1 Tax=Naegleria gruberi TaxID=5762 RepID=D2VZE9_NAEGR|nr:uncharacterized protein NAEGRDRAFT_74466 [Naegleria gruberi]EFC37833.1 predicted protein [Naegleria gruberi]|eukprot:XP_002670577.1 predicted protein [Naegleria gruberi strain NEG-M]